MDVWNKSPTGNVVPPGTIPVLCLALTNFTRRPLYPFRFPEACPINFHVVAEINFCSGWTSCVWELSLLGDVSEFQHCLFQLLKCHIPQREHIFQKKLQNAWGGTVEFSSPYNRSPWCSNSTCNLLTWALTKTCFHTWIFKHIFNSIW